MLTPRFKQKTPDSNFSPPHNTVHTLHHQCKPAGAEQCIVHALTDSPTSLTFVQSNRQSYDPQPEHDSSECMRIPPLGSVWISLPEWHHQSLRNKSCIGVKCIYPSENITRRTMFQSAARSLFCSVRNIVRFSTLLFSLPPRLFFVPLLPL